MIKLIRINIEAKKITYRGILAIACSIGYCQALTTGDVIMGERSECP
jgi:hypothetical protein